MARQRREPLNGQELAAQQLSALVQVGELFDRAGYAYWLFGGWAVDFHVGALTRRHDDIDLAVWLHELPGVGAVLEADGWQHKPSGEDDGGTGYGRGSVRLELTYLVPGDGGRIFIPLRAGSALWSEEPLGNAVRKLLGARARVVGLDLLMRGKSSPRGDHDTAAKDNADYLALSRIVP
jgi:hypothetical protein